MYNRIEKLCKERGTTITAVCTLVTGSSGNLSTWKKGYMRSDYLLKVSEYLNVSMDYLLTGKEKNSFEDLNELESECLEKLKQLDKFDKKLVLERIDTILAKNQISIETAARTDIEKIKNAKSQKY